MKFGIEVEGSFRKGRETIEISISEKSVEVA